ncbi:MAG: hypothetical protein A2075_18960 [Geobacteraceae bacterium GWC2_58_44]|nr:MAG: hypothetical protein A2075_18960 [Geobacteraceae bacterium GWC2_58_44]HBG07889.1 hypothetical protein [Geobacter sp.]
MQTCSFQVLLSQLNRDVDDLAPGILNEYPLEKYSVILERRNQFAGYRDPGVEVTRLCKAIKERGGDQLLGLYHRSLLLHLIIANGGGFERSSFPEPIKIEFSESFNRIVSGLEAKPPELYSWGEDLFCKDLAICCFRMFPARCLKVEMRVGIPRSFLMRIKAAELVRFSALMMRLGGFSPYFENHLDLRGKDGLSPEVRHHAMKLIGQMVKLSPGIKGVIGASWYYDPQIQAISPRLSYLRQQLQDAGGEFFFAGRSDRVTRLAISASATRRRLHEEGSYQPTNYMVVWPREKVLEWLDRGVSR